ncbi:MAG: trigger factor [Bacteroidetes bacterium GWE2_41_25]|nr:MAG: trigger factor [Bacteroidetes bacterium GWA2_40_15]OFX90080.1 MAG: trigger factor [Bacteroidetes bacterium GWC2_40_22]OFX95060.1 MAG: trigger factor [Bacteroidetes bacterium GWE2_41_25]OFY58068.1 MAG: trigger factor [Bacteroidetes bacterium GWF2_41_9]HBH82759.1 trigger factor [Bacteroidales bacterium]
MNITRENIDELNAVLKVEISKPDYEDKVETILKDYRKKANIKGFRPGMVPIGLVKKMYGKAVQIDEINKLVTESIRKYLSDEKIEILGDPLPKLDENEKTDFDIESDFTFSFELGLTPAVELKLSKKNKVTLHEIIIDEKMKNDYLNNYTRRFGELKQADSTEDKDVIKGKIEAVDDEGNSLPGGPVTDETSLGIDIIKDDDIKKQFIGKALNDTIDFDIRKAFPNDTEIAGILRMKKEEIENINGNFRFTINSISRFYPAEVGKELFDKIYGEGIVGNEEEFMKKLEEEIAMNLKRESDFKLMMDIKALALEKTDLQLPEEFLKKWLLRVHENTTRDQIDTEFDNFRKDLKWQLIRNKVARENEVKISEEELLKEAENITRYQFQQYGLFYVTDEHITNYAKETLKREEDAKRIADKILEEKVILLMKDLPKIENKSVTVDEFNKLFE